VITLCRSQVRRFRQVFRRSILGITNRGIVPPLVLRAEGAQLRAQHRYHELTVELVEPGSYRPMISIAIPLDALADFEGRNESPVVLEVATPNRTIVRWEDRGIPQSREYDVIPVDPLAPMPELPATWASVSSDLLTALTEASESGIRDSPRYALDCIQLRGTRNQILATDGHQLYACSGFSFPWEGDVLIKGSPLFACRALPRDQPIQIGKTETHVALRIGDWTLWCEIPKDVRFPDVERAIPEVGAGTTRLRLDPQDARFLESALERLPGGDEAFSPVTIDLNGDVTLRARAADQPQVTELVLDRSSYSGASVRINTNRNFLGRALRLGFREVAIPGVEMPLVCRDHGVTFAWQPLSADAAIGPDDNVVRIESSGANGGVNRVQNQTENARRPTGEPAPRNNPRAAHPVGTNGHTRSADADTANGHAGSVRPVGAESHAGAENPGTSLAALIQEAESLHAALADAKSRTARLITGLRRHRKQSRLLSETLKSLRQLKLQDVGT
jgi:hypothetical protein